MGKSSVIIWTNQWKEAQHNADKWMWQQIGYLVANDKKYKGATCPICIEKHKNTKEFIMDNILKGM